MIVIDEILNFLFEHRDDDRVSISKKMKYGYRHYYLNFTIDEDPDKSRPTQLYRYRESLEVVIDNRNKCIEFVYDHVSNIIIEDTEMVEKWSEILDKYLSSKIDNELISVFEEALSSCYNKNLYREYQMKKIFPEDESI